MEREACTGLTRQGRAPTVVSVGIALAGLIAACGSSTPSRTPQQTSRSSGATSVSATPSSNARALDGARSWFYYIGAPPDSDLVERIRMSSYDVVVLDLTTSQRANEQYPLGNVVHRLQTASHAKRVLAYVDIGEAENWRAYWQPGWRVGSPSWIVASDPDGWKGNYPVAYWRNEWHKIWLDDGGMLSKVLSAGFDGVYLDWVEGYSDDRVVEAARKDRVDPQAEIVRFVAELASRGRAEHPGFLVVGQNAAELAATDRDYRQLLDAVAQEQVWFDGGGDNEPPGDCALPATGSDVDTPAYRDSLSAPCLRIYDEFPDSTLHVSSESYLRDLRTIKASGVPVFTVDYAVNPTNAAKAIERSRAEGFIPFVGQRKLDTWVPPADQ